MATPRSDDRMGGCAALHIVAEPRRAVAADRRVRR